MANDKLYELDLERVVIDWFQELGYGSVSGPAIAPDEPGSERASFSDVLLMGRLHDAITRINPTILNEACEEAIRKVTHSDLSTLVGMNRAFHLMLRDGVEVEYRRDDGSIAGDQVRLVDYANPDNNDWLVVNQFTVVEGGHDRRPDVVVFINGLPISVIELKSVSDEKADVWSAWNQLQTYKKQIPSLFRYNELLIVSDGVNARLGSLTANKEWFKIWREIDQPTATLELKALIHGVFGKERLLELLQHFIVFEDDTDSNQVYKIIAGYHQFHAVQQATESTVNATRPEGDRRGGVVWHTQGSGKSFSMLFFAGRIVRHAEMNNPTLVVLTDRNDLDDQLFGQFQRCSELLRQTPVQADSVKALRELLKVSSGGVVFTTIQKFATSEKGASMPMLSDRKNIVVIADEAHRSQYDMIDGFARNLRDALPYASFIGFTGTPIERSDANTRAVFGDYVSIYDIKQAVEDKATVPIY